MIRDFNFCAVVGFLTKGMELSPLGMKYLEHERQVDVTGMWFMFSSVATKG